MPTHEIVYVNKDDEVQVVRPMSQQETDDAIDILERNNALYTVQDLRSIGRVVIPVQ